MSTIPSAAQGHYPTPQHERAAAEILASSASSRTRKRAADQLVRARQGDTRQLSRHASTRGTEQVAHLDEAWRRYARGSSAIANLKVAGRWTDVHLDVTDGEFDVRQIDHELDWLEVEVGNLLGYSITLFESGDRLRELRAEWLPFYDDELRTARLIAARMACLSYLERIPWALDRQLWFHALARLHGAFSWFLLALHVKHRTYPIAYDKWIREQIVDNLSLPELYERLPALFEIEHLESRELEEKANHLNELVQVYLA